MPKKVQDVYLAGQLGPSPIQILYWLYRYWQQVLNDIVKSQIIVMQRVSLYTPYCIKEILLQLILKKVLKGIFNTKLILWLFIQQPKRLYTAREVYRPRIVHYIKLRLGVHLTYPIRVFNEVAEPFAINQSSHS